MVEEANPESSHPVEQATVAKMPRPKLGIGIIVLNELDEVICSQRLDPGTAFHNVW